MRPILAATLATLALATSPALAGPFAALQAPVDAAELAQPVELKLYTGEAGMGFTPRIAVSFEAAKEDATMPPHLRLAMLSSGGRANVISSGYAEKLGLKVKHKKVGGEKVDYVVVDDMWLGDERQVHLAGVTFIVDQTPEPQLEDKDSFDDVLLLDLGTTGLAWAVRPSTGTVHLAPADQAAGLLAAVGGTTLPYRTADEQKVKYGKAKSWISGMDLIVAATVGGASTDLVLELAGASDLSTDVATPADAPTSTWADRSWKWLSTDLGGLSLGSWWYRQESAYKILGPSVYDGGAVTLGSVGGRVLTRVDIAVDPVNHQVALAPAKTQQRHDPRAWLLTQAEADLKACLEPAEPLPEDQADVPAGERCAGPYADLAMTKGMTGDLAGALEALTTVAEAAPHDCTNWVSVAQVQLAQGDATPALESFSKASELYHAWFAMDPWARDDAQKAFDKLSEEEQDAATVRPQSDSCSVADRGMADVNFALGNAGEVERIYTTYMDLDPGLAAIYGAQLTLQDKVEEAHGPYRMIDHVSLRKDDRAKAGLGHLFAQQGDWASADVNYQVAMRMTDADSAIALLWAQDALAALGEQDALHQARQLAAAHPADLDQLGAVARIARLAGKDTAFLTGTADAIFAEEAALNPNWPVVQATYARYLLDTGRVEQAAAIIDRVVKDNPGAALIWVAKAELHELQGDSAQARKAYLRAVKMADGDPAILLLAGKTR